MSTTSPTGRPAPVCYVYGVVRAGTDTPRDVEGIGDPPSPLVLVPHRRIAAVVSEIDPERPLGTPGDLLGHARVLDTLAAARTPVLPLRFGAVVTDARAVADDLLAPQEQRFLGALADLAGLAQFTVRGAYRQERILREIVEERTDIARLRAQVTALSEEAGRPRRIRLGELVSEELAARGRADTDALVDVLGPLAAEVSAAEPSADQPVTISFLVASDRWQEFANAVAEAADSRQERITLRLLGPLAPYDFAPQVVDAQGSDRPWD